MAGIQFGPLACVTPVGVSVAVQPGRESSLLSAMSFV